MSEHPILQPFLTRAMQLMGASRAYRPHLSWPGEGEYQAALGILREHHDGVLPVEVTATSGRSMTRFVITYDDERRTIYFEPQHPEGVAHA